MSHRGPVRFEGRGPGQTVQRNGGGLVTALEGLVQEVGQARWICAPASADDQDAARAGRWAEFATGAASADVLMLDLDADAHSDFYNVIANPLLWFVQHGLYADKAPSIDTRVLRAWHRGYVEVNRVFARALTHPMVVPRDGIVMIHDYHFYLLPAMIRPARPDVLLHHFTHIPWPAPAAWSVLPAPMRSAVFRGLLGSDIVGFQTRGDARNFLLGCRELLGLPVDFRRSSVVFERREITVRHYPISINATAIEAAGSTPAVESFRREIARDVPGQLVLRVDRADPSKNIVRGFEAFGRMLRAHRECHGRVTFLALLQPTRGDVPEYGEYLRQIHAVVDDVNREFSTPEWTPIDLRLVDDLELAYAAYKQFDVLMVNSVADGMNLVVKEALVLNENDGVAVLSERAGAFDELAGVVVDVDPVDVDQQARALHEALVMPIAERRRRLQLGADIVHHNDINKWLDNQLADIASAKRVASASRSSLRPAS
ncbi:MAG TPA: trehalose-6-phosphate synthase [Acidimicrobiia bacterium]|nr:trehalose-6-phosphate synthase [Acidimicrobiia bacterium]